MFIEFNRKKRNTNYTSACDSDVGSENRVELVLSYPTNYSNLVDVQSHPKKIPMLVNVRFCPIRMNAAATTNRCLDAGINNLLHHFHFFIVAH